MPASFVLRASGKTQRPQVPAHGRDGMLQVPEANVFVLVDGSTGTDAKLALEAVQRFADRLLECGGRMAASAHAAERLAMSRLLEEAFREANREVLAKTDASHSTTSLLGLAIAGTYAYVAHVGGCRAYLMRRDTLQWITIDHTLGMKKVQKEEMTAEAYEASPMRRYLTRSIGGAADVTVDVAELRLQPGDQLLLASDGLTGRVSDEHLVEILDGRDADQMVAALCEAAQGSDDDATAFLVKVGAETGTRTPSMALRTTTDEALLQALRQVFLFAALSEAEIRQVSAYLEERYAKKDEVLFREGDPGHSFFIVLTGRLHVTRGETFLIEVGPTEHVGELALVLDQPRTATVAATEPTRMLELSRESFLEIVERRPDIGARLALACLRVMATRLSETTDRLGMLEAAHFASGEPAS
ncbi:MAG: cyclic nucleotide-binding domain-containing protein [Acidobacteriota bacterium]